MPRPQGTPNRRPKADPVRRAFTDRFIKTVKPADERRTYYDTKRPGLALRVEPTGVKSYKFYYRHGGRPRWFTIGRVERVALEDARKRVRKLDGQVAAGHDPQAEKRALARAGTFGELVKLYLAETTNKSKAQYELQLERWALPKWRALKCAAVTKAEVRALIRSRTRKSPTSAALLLAAISAVFKWGMQNDVVDLSVNPAHGIATAKAEKRERVLSDDEVPRFWQAFDEEDLLPGTALKVLLSTGQRPGEVAAMRWQDVEPGRHAFDYVTRDGKVKQVRHVGAWWNLPGTPEGQWPGTKNGQPHRVWLTPDVLALLDEVDDGHRDGLVFETGRGKPVDGLDKVMQRICRDLGVTRPDMTAEEKKRAKVTPHDLRRTHGTTVTALGFTRDQMNRVQNHLEGGIASVYDRHEYADEARRVQAAVGQRLAQLVEGGGAAVVDLAEEKSRRGV